MELSREDLQLIFDALYADYPILADRFEAYLTANENEQAFTLIGESLRGQLAFTAFVTSGTLDLEQRVAELERVGRENEQHITELIQLIERITKHSGHS